MAFKLVACDQNGIPLQTSIELPEALVENLKANAALYQRVGFIPPWIGYIAVDDDRVVGGGAFVGPPVEQLVEIAYFTLDNEQGKGYALKTAQALVDIAYRFDPMVKLKAFTLKHENPSTKVLESLGFFKVGVAKDDDVGEVWEWRN